MGLILFQYWSLHQCLPQAHLKSIYTRISFVSWLSERKADGHSTLYLVVIFAQPIALQSDSHEWEDRQLRYMPLIIDVHRESCDVCVQTAYNCVQVVCS